MNCNICGRHTQNQEANFCEYCGSSFREHMNVNFQQQQQMQQPIEPSANTGEGVISFKYWLGVYGILFVSAFIPYIGIFIPLVLLCVWAFDNKTSPSKKNWARATLIFLVVYFIVAVVMIISMLTSPEMKDIIGTLGLGSMLGK